MSVNILKIVETLKPELVDEMVKLRDTGNSFDIIAVWMTGEIGHSIGRESIRTWFKAFDERTGAVPAKAIRAPNKPLIVTVAIKAVRGEDGSMIITDAELDGSGFVHDPYDLPEGAGISDEAVQAHVEGMTSDPSPSWHDHKHVYLDRGNGTKKCACGDVVSV